MRSEVVQTLGITMYKYHQDIMENNPDKSVEDYFYELASIALHQLREPTNAMILAGQTEPNGIDSGSVWRAMIDAAKETP